MKYPKNVKALDRTFYLVGKQGMLYQWKYVTASRKETLCKIQEMSQKMFGKFALNLLLYEHIRAPFQDDISYMT